MYKMYLGGYGHDPDPKDGLFAYWGTGNYRTGQNVVVPVTHSISRKNYKTMFTILHSSQMYASRSEAESKALHEAGIRIKDIYGINVLADLPSGRFYKSKAEWARESAQRQKATEQLLTRTKRLEGYPW